MKPFSNLASLSITGWCPETFLMISLTVLEKQTKWQTDTTENDNTLGTLRCVGGQNTQS